MTDRVAALNALLACDGPERESALDAFAARYGEDALILDMWFGLQARVPGAASVQRVRALTTHPKFTLANPNRARALIATFANANLRGFHAPDGSGYALVAEIIAALDDRNPQIAAGWRQPSGPGATWKPGAGRWQKRRCASSPARRNSRAISATFWSARSAEPTPRTAPNETFLHGPSKGGPMPFRLSLMR